MDQRDVTAFLNFYHHLGVREIGGDVPTNRLVPKKRAPKATQADHPAKNCETLEDLYAALRAYEGCDLKKSAINTVIADGNPQAPVMLVGEAPGADEDRLGKPFVGLSGQLLDKMFSTIGLSRDKNIYISNIVNWRPPGNRQPTSQEIALCQPFIEKHIALIKPKVLVMLGGVAAKTLLNTAEGIVKLRGQWIDYTNPFLSEPIQTIALFHPAYLLRSPGQKALVWQDLLKIKKHLQSLGLNL